MPECLSDYCEVVAGYGYTGIIVMIAQKIVSSLEREAEFWPASVVCLNYSAMLLPVCLPEGGCNSIPVVWPPCGRVWQDGVCRTRVMRVSTRDTVFLLEHRILAHISSAGEGRLSSEQNMLTVSSGQSSVSADVERRLMFDSE